MDRAIRGMRVAILAIELLVSLALILIAIGVLMSLGTRLWDTAWSGGQVTSAQFNQLVGPALEVFILVELFRIAVAYMKHRRVIPTVLEAALVAVARKLVVFEGQGDYLRNAVALSALLLAVSISWMLLARSRVTGGTESKKAMPPP